MEDTLVTRSVKVGKLLSASVRRYIDSQVQGLRDYCASMMSSIDNLNREIERIHKIHVEKNPDSHVKAFQMRAMRANENLITYMDGQFGGRTNIGRAKSNEGPQYRGCLIITDQRLVCYRKGFSGDRLESIAFSSIESIETVSRRHHCILTVNTDSRMIIFTVYTGDEGFKSFCSVIDARMSPASAKAVMREDPRARLKSLQEMREEGLITEAEFQQKRAVILELM